MPESVLGIRLLQRGYVAQYDVGKAFVVVEASPESATALMAKLHARFPDTTPAQIADDAFLLNDQYLGHLCVFRKGRYLGRYGNVAQGQGPLALARSLAAKIP